jgi:hypothetical protein
MDENYGTPCGLFSAALYRPVPLLDFRDTNPAAYLSRQVEAAAADRYVNGLSATASLTNTLPGSSQYLAGGQSLLHEAIQKEGGGAIASPWPGPARASLKTPTLHHRGFYWWPRTQSGTPAPHQHHAG